MLTYKWHCPKETLPPLERNFLAKLRQETSTDILFWDPGHYHKTQQGIGAFCYVSPEYVSVATKDIEVWTEIPTYVPSTRRV